MYIGAYWEGLTLITKSLPLEFSLAVGSRGSHNRKGSHCDFPYCAALLENVFWSFPRCWLSWEVALVVFEIVDQIFSNTTS